MGDSALLRNVHGSSNTAIGNFALGNNDSDFNTAVGSGALGNNTTGDLKNAVGVQALDFNTSGAHNMAIGLFALRNNTSGNLDTALGDSAGGNVTTVDNVICIGAGQIRLTRILESVCVLVVILTNGDRGFLRRACARVMLS